MSLKPKVKCPFCGIEFRREEEEYINVKNRYWHKKCYEKYLIKIEEEEKQKLELQQKKDSLYKYICLLFGQEKVSIKIAKQINKLISEYNFTYSGIEKSLKYFYEVKNNSIAKANDSIMIVPWIYEDAKKYYYNLFMTHLKNNNIEIKKENNTIYSISKPQAKNLIKIIDLDNIIEGDEYSG